MLVDAILTPSLRRHLLVRYVGLVRPSLPASHQEVS